MKTDNKENSNKNELIIDGKAVRFHYNKQDRLTKAKFSRVNKSGQFLNGKHYFWLIMQSAMVLFVIFAFNIIVGNSKTVKENGFIFILSKEPYNFDKYIKFYFTVKNETDKVKEIDFVEFDFIMINDKNETLYTKNFLITNSFINPGEKYREMIIVDKPSKGKYKAVINFGINKEKQIIYYFNNKFNF